MPDAGVLAEPITLPSGTVLKNRLAKSALSEQLGTKEHAPSFGLERLYARWAGSGAGLLVTGNVMVDRTAIAEPLNVVVDAATDPERLANWAAAARSGGAQVLMQLNHPGRQVPRTITNRPVAPSAVALKGMAGVFATPRELTSAEISELVGRFADSARIAVAAGFTGVQIHAAHGYLISQFLSPLTNLRSDEWGSDALRRRRFLLEIVRAVRAEVGSAVPVAVKLNSADFQRGGFTQDESLDVAGALVEEGIDLLEVSGGTYEAPTTMLGTPQSQAASTRAREAYFLDYAQQVRTHVSIPLMLTGGFRTLEGMTAAVDGGAIDIVGLGRPMALEPELPGLLLAGKTAASNVRPRRVGIRKLDGMSELVWHTTQLWRIGQGKDPNPKRHSLVGLLHYTAATGVHSLRRRPRRGTAPKPSREAAKSSAR